MELENSLSDRLQMAVRRISGRGKLNEKDIDEMMREVRLSLLEADVNFRVVREFTSRVKEQAMGEKILKGLNPGQQVIKVVHDELKYIMGEENAPLTFNEQGITTFMTIGLQGSGKTTSIGKLGVYLRKQTKKKIMFIAADVYRPAAIDQLKTIGKQINIDVYDEGIKDARDIVRNGLEYAKENKYEIVIIDTAGRLHIDEDMMGELIDVKEIANPEEILLTVDAMTGQDAAQIAKSFHDQLSATGAILTKLDGDTRGGAALSIREVSGIPIKFSSFGESMDTFEAFHPERMASRILGMGDVLTLIDKATEAIDEDEAKNMMERMMSDKFDYNDLLKQLKMIKRMGSISRIVGFIPGLGKLRKAAGEIDDKQFDSLRVIIDSMTEEEKRNPELINKSSSRRKRIATGSGVSVSDVNNLRQSLEAQKKMVQRMSNMSERELEELSKDPSKLMNQQGQGQRRSRGKGKGKGNFRR